MPDTRRSFLRSTVAFAAATGGACASGAEANDQGREPAAGALRPAFEIQVPKMKFFHAEISRVVLGANPFCGFSHFNNNLANCMREWYTPDRVCAVMHQATLFGINAFNYVHLGRGPQDWVRFLAEGGQMHREFSVSLRKGLGSSPGGESGSPSPVFGKQGIHVVADTVPEVVADGTYLVEPGDQGIAVAGR